MARTLLEDLRGRVIAAVEPGASWRAAVDRSGVGMATATRWVRMFRVTAMVSSQPKGGDLRSHRIEALRDVVLAAIKAQKDITFTELVSLLQRKHGSFSAISTVHRHLPRYRITQERAAHAARQDRPDVAHRRQALSDAQPDLDPARLVFIDETSVSTKMARLRWRSPHGQRCRAAVQHGH